MSTLSLPDDVRDDHSICSYVHLHSGSNSPLHDDYCHYVRLHDERDDPDNHLYYGEWTDITNIDKRRALIAKLEQEREEIEKRLNKLKNKQEDNHE